MSKCECPSNIIADFLQHKTDLTAGQRRTLQEVYADCLIHESRHPRSHALPGSARQRLRGLQIGQHYYHPAIAELIKAKRSKIT